MKSEFNKILDAEFKKRGWLCQPQVFDNDDDAYARFDFMKDRIGVEVQFGHASFIGIDLLKFQVASYSGLDSIDFGIYITTTKAFQKHLQWTEIIGKEWRQKSFIRKRKSRL